MASSLESYPAFFSKFEVEENSNSFLDALFKGLIILTVKNYIFLDLCSLNTPGQVTSCPKTYLNTLIKSPLTLHFGKLPRLGFSTTTTSLQQIQITFWPFLWFLLNMIWQKKYYCKDSLYDVGPASVYIQGFYLLFALWAHAQPGIYSDSPLPFIGLLSLFFYATGFLGIGKTTSVPLDHWYMIGFCYQFECPGSDGETLQVEDL